MALTNVIRRAVSGVIPSTIRATGSQRHYHYHHMSLFPTFAPITCTGALSRNLFRSSFSTRTQQHAHTSRHQCDTTLVKLVDSEIRDKVIGSKFLYMAEYIPDNFPFKIEDEPGLRTLTLTRHYHGEKLTVVVDMPDLITGKEDEDDDDDDYETGNWSELPMTVSVSKKSVPCLELKIFVHPHGIEIETLAIKDPEAGDDENVYEGPDFEELDENLQKAFKNYLGIRGINHRSTNFLHRYMINKASEEYVRWWTKVKTFVEA